MATLNPRWRSLGSALFIIALGLLWRRLRLPGAKVAGDLLWAAMVLYLLRAAWPRRRLVETAALALAISWLVEFSQLLHFGWLDAIRHTRAGHLVLGSTFNPPDLLAYAAGVALAAALESRYTLRDR